VEFTWPVMLVGLVAVPLLAAAYASVRRYQARAAQAFADPHLLPLLRSGRPPRAPWLPFACYLGAVALLVVASARPVAAIPFPTNQAALVVGVDTSKSMVATDISPSRLEAAKRMARELVANLPRSLRVGLVAFSDYAQVLVAPTTDRREVLEAIDRLQPQQATSIGSAILMGVRALPGRERAGEDLLRRQQGLLPTVPPSPPPASDLPPGALVLFSDGVSNFGVDPAEAVQVARQYRVRVHTVGVGTPTGQVQTVDGQLVFIPFDPTGLQQVAQMTGGRYFYPPTVEDFRAIGRELGRAVTWQRQRTEVTSLVAALGGLLMLAGGALSLVWFRRVP
jgi:Ca-activated chloride channel family protein